MRAELTEPVRSERPLLTRAAASVPVVIAVSLGVLYALGALIKASELSHAGYAVRDTLPLIPVQEFLARGIALFYDNIVAILVFLLVFAASVLYGRWAFRTTDDFRQRLADVQARTESLQAATTGPGNISDEADAIVHESEELTKALRDNDPNAPDARERAAELGIRADELRKRGDALQQRSEALGQDHDAFNKAIEALNEAEAKVDRVGAFVDWLPLPDAPRLRTAIVAAFLLSTLPFTTPTFAVGWWLPYALFNLVPPLRERLSPYPQLVVIPIVWLLACALFTAAVAPADLPSVTLTKRGGEKTRGVLIAESGTTWYVGQAHGRFTGIDKRDVATATVTPVGRHDPKLLFQYFT